MEGRDRLYGLPRQLAAPAYALGGRAAISRCASPPSRWAPGKIRAGNWRPGSPRPDNPYFAKAIVNRIWFWLLGRGIVHEPDDLRPTNPPSNPELLA